MGDRGAGTLFFCRHPITQNDPSKASQIAALLRSKTVFYVNIETPDGQGSITETTLESPEGTSSGIAVSAEGDTLTFKTDDKTASSRWKPPKS